MSEELNQEVIPADNTSAEPQHADTGNDVEARAREQGWVPKEEFKGQGKWRDAESFLDRGELFEKIDAQKRQLRDLQKNQEAFSAHLNTVRQAEYKRAIDALRKEKRDALMEGNPDAVIEVDEKLTQMQLEHQAQQQAMTQAQRHQGGEAHPDFVEWKARNQWYETGSTAMRAYADAIGMQMAGEGKSPKEVLKEVEREVRTKFPEKFNNPNRTRSTVEGTTGRSSNAKSDTYELTESERAVMNRLIKSGALTKEEYIADLKKVKGN